MKFVKFIHHDPHAVVQLSRYYFSEVEKEICYSLDNNFAVGSHRNQEIVCFLDIFPHPIKTESIQAGAVMQPSLSLIKDALQFRSIF